MIELLLQLLIILIPVVMGAMSLPIVLVKTVARIPIIYELQHYRVGTLCKNTLWHFVQKSSVPVGFMEQQLIVHAW